MILGIIMIIIGLLFGNTFIGQSLFLIGLMVIAPLLGILFLPILIFLIATDFMIE